MWAATLRSYSPQLLQPWKLGFSTFNHSLSSISKHMGLLELQEVEKILSDVRADNVKVIPANKQHDWADFMVIATGRSTWHVRNIAQALIYQAGKVIIHALDENAREYYNLEDLWTSETSEQEPMDLENVMVKVRRINNSKRPPPKDA
uniref:Protein Iojap-related, mitochondrial n=1 Tax=Cannabis sativa TaxID=3483 RepID=A0A803P342_CANSA